MPSPSGTLRASKSAVLPICHTLATNEKNEEWRLVEAGLNHRAVVKADTKAVAILEMQGYMKTYEGSVRIQKVNFRIQEE